MIWDTYKMSQKFQCLPSEVWGVKTNSPRGFYLNRGVWLFGSMVDSEMDAAANAARKAHGKKGTKGAEKFINSERLRVLGKHLHEDVKRFREPANIKTNNKVNVDSNKDVEQALDSSFFKLKGQ